MTNETQKPANAVKLPPSAFPYLCWVDDFTTEGLCRAMETRYVSIEDDEELSRISYKVGFQVICVTDNDWVRRRDEGCPAAPNYLLTKYAHGSRIEGTCLLCGGTQQEPTPLTQEQAEKLYHLLVALERSR